MKHQRSALTHQMEEKEAQKLDTDAPEVGLMEEVEVNIYFSSIFVYRMSYMFTKSFVILEIFKKFIYKKKEISYIWDILYGNIINCISYQNKHEKCHDRI